MLKNNLVILLAHVYSMLSRGDEMIHQSTWHKATLGGIAGFVLVMNLAGCGDISSTTSAARSSANAMATHIDSGLSGGTQNDAAQIGTVGDSEEGSGDTGSGAETFHANTRMRFGRQSHTSSIRIFPKPSYTIS